MGATATARSLAIADVRESTLICLLTAAQRSLDNCDCERPTGNINERVLSTHFGPSTRRDPNGSSQGHNGHLRSHALPIGNLRKGERSRKRERRNQGRVRVARWGPQRHAAPKGFSAGCAAHRECSHRAPSLSTLAARLLKRCGPSPSHSLSSSEQSTTLFSRMAPPFRSSTRI